MAPDRKVAYFSNEMPYNEFLDRSMAVVAAIDAERAKLNELTGIEFARDAWENMAPDQYGVVTLGMEPQAMYADGKLIDETYQVTVDIYTTGSSDEWPALVRNKLEELNDTYDWLDLTCRLTERAYLFDIDKVHWVFTVRFFGPVTRTLTVEGGGT